MLTLVLLATATFEIKEYIISELIFVVLLIQQNFISIRFFNIDKKLWLFYLINGLGIIYLLLIICLQQTDLRLLKIVIIPLMISGIYNAIKFFKTQSVNNN